MTTLDQRVIYYINLRPVLVNSQYAAAPQVILLGCGNWIIIGSSVHWLLVKKMA